MLSMHRSGRLIFTLSLVTRRNMSVFSTAGINFHGRPFKVQEPVYLSRALQHSLSYQNIKVLKTWDFLRSSSSVDMSTSVDEEFRHLDYDQLVESKCAPNNVIIDVREKHELEETGEIPGAHHIPLGDIEKAFNTPEDEFKKIYNFDKPSLEHSVIFSCRSGKRSLVALEKALAIGFKNAKHYKGGWLDWEKHLSESKN